MKKDTRPFVIVLGLLLTILFGKDVAYAILGPIVDVIQYTMTAN